VNLIKFKSTASYKPEGSSFQSEKMWKWVLVAHACGAGGSRL
jgi:hypothetical protein